MVYLVPIYFSSTGITVLGRFILIIILFVREPLHAMPNSAPRELPLGLSPFQDQGFWVALRYYKPFFSHCSGVYFFVCPTTSFNASCKAISNAAS